MDEPQVHTMTVYHEHDVERHYCPDCGRVVYIVPETGDVAVYAAGDETADHLEVG